ncbi:hypothetical protein MKX08_001495 [Trichoderma sp. CBMAI-0020]|nr:hypothetical protein MKX08_001495 [Trichoderma sp. CBMAI-0020]
MALQSIKFVIKYAKNAFRLSGDEWLYAMPSCDYPDNWIEIQPGDKRPHRSALSKLFGLFGYSHKHMIDAVKADPGKFVATIVSTEMKLSPESYRPLSAEDARRLLGVYWSDMINSAWSHLYKFCTKTLVRDAAKAIRKGGVYPLVDIGTFPGFGGLVRGDRDGMEFIKLIEACDGDASKIQAVIEAHKSKHMANYHDVIESGQAPIGPCYLVLGDHIAEYCGDYWIEDTADDGAVVKGQAMLLKPVVWHPFVGWIIHAHLITGPDEVTSLVLGGGEGNTPFVDAMNSWAAPSLWTAIKILGGLRWTFNRDKKAGLIKESTTFEKWVNKNHPYLTLHLLMIRGLLAFGNGPAWLQHVFGRPEKEALTKNEYIEMRKTTQQAGGVDYRFRPGYFPDGTRDPMTKEVKPWMGDGLWIGDEQLLAGQSASWTLLDLATPSMRRAREKHRKTQIAYLKYSGESKGDADVEKGALATAVADATQKMVDKTKAKVKKLLAKREVVVPGVRFASGTVKEPVTVLMAKLKQQIYDQARIDDVLQLNDEEIKALLPGLLKTTMAGLERRSQAKQTSIPEELSNKRVTVMLHEACRHRTVYAFALWEGGNSAEFMPCAMEEAATRLAISQIDSEIAAAKTKRNAAKTAYDEAAQEKKPQQSVLDEFKARAVKQVARIADLESLRAEMDERYAKAVRLLEKFEKKP